MTPNQTNLWEIVIVAALVSYLLRVLPAFLLGPIQIDEDSRLIRFLNYSVCALIGGIIYSSTYSDKNIFDLVYNFSYADLFRLLFLIATFLVSSFLQRPIASFIISIILYAFILA